HWQAVAVAACEQCGRNRVPPVHEALSLADWLAAHAQPAQDSPESATRLVLSLQPDAIALRDAVPAKLYDYLPFEAPILAIGGMRGVLAHLLAWSGAGAWMTAPEAIADVLRAHFQRWQADGVVRAPRHPAALAYLTQRRMAAEFAEVFNATVEHRPIACRPGPPWEGE
ncbi:MAG TPA: hypothetical protein PLZ36_18620, partial [Armatimonadota bacterium]|nr:hypothetical protein [Armatimonadota bacterium]